MSVKSSGSSWYYLDFAQFFDNLSLVLLIKVLLTKVLLIKKACIGLTWHKAVVKSNHSNTYRERVFWDFN